MSYIQKLTIDQPIVPGWMQQVVVHGLQPLSLSEQVPNLKRLDFSVSVEGYDTDSTNPEVQVQELVEEVLLDSHMQEQCQVPLSRWIQQQKFDVYCAITFELGWRNASGPLVNTPMYSVCMLTRSHITELY